MSQTLKIAIAILCVVVTGVVLFSTYQRYELDFIYGAHWGIAAGATFFCGLVVGVLMTTKPLSMEQDDEEVAAQSTP